MSARSRLELLLVRDGERTTLASPEVGLFTEALEAGALLGPGQRAGAIVALGRHFDLVVPNGAHGRVANERPERVQAPVGFGTTLYELTPIDAGDGAVAGEDDRESAGAQVLRAPQTGRLYRRASPEDPPYVEAGDSVTDGQAVGLLEVMKTFSQVLYQAGGGLPERAAVVRWLVEDGAEVREGDPLLEVEGP